MLARPNKRFLSSLKRKKVSSRQRDVSGRSVHFSLVPKPLRWRGGFWWGPDEVLGKHINSMTGRMDPRPKPRHKNTQQHFRQALKKKESFIICF